MSDGRLTDIEESCGSRKSRRGHLTSSSGIAADARIIAKFDIGGHKVFTGNAPNSMGAQDYHTVAD